MIKKTIVSYKYFFHVFCGETGSILSHRGVEKDFRPARKAHPALLVDDLDSLLETIQTAGYETDESQPPLEGFKRAHVFDPFGNRIELLEKA